MNAKVTAVIVILLALFAAGGFYLGQNYKLVPTSQTAPATTITIPSSLPTPTAMVASVTTTPSPTLTPTGDEKVIYPGG